MKSQLVYIYPGESFAYFVRPSHWSVHVENIGVTPNQYNFGNSAGFYGGPKIFEMDVEPGQILYVGHIELSVGEPQQGWFAMGRRSAGITRKDEADRMRQEVQEKLQATQFEFISNVPAS